MPIPSGLSAQLGLAEEVSYGTIVTPNRFFEFNQESLKLTIDRIESAGLRAGTRTQRSDRWATGKRSVGGSIDMELHTKGLGLILKHMFGGVVTSQPNSGTAPTVYRHDFTPGDFLPGLTLQVGRPDVGGVVRPFTYTGCRFSEWSLSAAVGELAKLSLTVLGRDETTQTALATAAYPTNTSLFTFVQGALTVGGAPVPVKSFKLDAKNSLADDRFFLGSALRSVPIESGFREYTGTIEPEFNDLTLYNNYVNGAETSLELKFEGATIQGTYKYTLDFLLNVRYDGDTPNASGREVLQNPLNFKAVGNTDATAISAYYQTTDTLP